MTGQQQLALHEAERDVEVCVVLRTFGTPTQAVATARSVVADLQTRGYTLAEVNVAVRGLAGEETLAQRML